MSPLLIPILALLIPIVAILAGTYTQIKKEQNRTAERLGRATGHLDAALEEAKIERDRLRERVEALEAIVTSERYDLDRDARAAGIGRIDPALLDEPADASAEAASTPPRRVRS